MKRSPELSAPGMAVAACTTPLGCPREAVLATELPSVRSGRVRVSRWNTWLWCLGLLAACQTDTAGLERHDTPAGASGGSGGAGSDSPSAAGAASTPEPAPEAPEPSSRAASLAVLDGLVDGGRLFVCLKAQSGFLSDAPEPPEGLSFGLFTHLPLDWDLAGADMQVELFSVLEPGEEAHSCAALELASVPPSPSLDAGVDGGASPPGPSAGPRRAGSSTLARGSLFPGRHYALVASGCAAPEALPAPDVCGPPEPLFGSRAELVLVEFGAQATEGGRYFGLQFLNASRAIAAADLSLQLNDPSVSVPFVSGVAFGVLRPRAVATVEQPLALELRGRGASAVAYSQLWSDTLEASSLQLEPGNNYLLASVGPRPGPDGLTLSAPKLVLIPAN